VIKALRDNGIEVTAIHNHMIDEVPRTAFVHFCANDDAVKLACGSTRRCGKSMLRKGRSSASGGLGLLQ
jgi:hypothetical protein